MNKNMFNHIAKQHRCFARLRGGCIAITAEHIWAKLEPFCIQYLDGGENKWHHGVQTSRPGESSFFMASKFAEIWMYSLADIFTMLTTSKPMSQMEMQLMMPNVA